MSSDVKPSEAQTPGQDERPMVAVDLGGTKLFVADVFADGRIGHSVRRPTDVPGGAEGVADEIVSAVNELRGKDGSAASRAGVAVGVAGQVDADSGVVLKAPNLDWTDFPLRERLSAALDLPVTLLNDVQSAAYGEWRFGAGRGVDDMVAIMVGTGVGGGLISRGRLVTGCGGSAGEVGHTVIDMNGPECTCGSRGCLEAVVGGWAIARRARQAVEREPGRASALLAAVDGDASALTAATVEQVADAGDALARELVRETGEALGVGLTSVVNMYNPCVIVVGGGVVDGIPRLVELAEQTMRQRALPAAARRVRLVRAGLEHSVAVGVAAWAWRGLEEAGPAGTAAGGTGNGAAGGSDAASGAGA